MGSTYGVPGIEPAGQAVAISVELTTILVLWSLLTSAMTGPSYQVAEVRYAEYFTSPVLPSYTRKKHSSA